MARNKYPEQTVSRILDISLKLFLEKGYEKTTIQDIVDHLGYLSKGAIYHHFSSKEDIIDAVIMRMYEEHNLFNKLKNEHLLNGLQKMKKVFVESITSEEQQQLLRSSPTLMKNPKFLSRHIDRCVSFYAPLLQTIIEEGISDGSITVDNSKELSEVVMLLVNVWLNPAVFSVTNDHFTQKIHFFKTLLDSIGLPVIDDEIMLVLNDFRSAIFS
ncbi:TetR/AcrR family transcriptional regulator [Niallia sp. 01092]|uniref:TetR/AcrR family transcriptional regulator n=1 Tax=Niallia sp. 01092 TaxID=3457759 RepID=UPI003FD5E8AF